MMPLPRRLPAPARALAAHPLSLGTPLRAKSPYTYILSRPQSYSRLSTSSTTSSGGSGGPNVKLTALASVALFTSAYLLYRYESLFTSGSTGEKYDSTFTTNIRHSRGTKSYTFDRKSELEIERILTEHQTRVDLSGRTGNPVVRWDTNQVGSNEPCEDRWASNLIPRTLSSSDVRKGQSGKLSPSSSTEEGGKKDLMLFSIIDGHAGDATSILLSKVLHPTLAVHLAGLQAGYLPDVSVKGWSGWFSKLNPLSRIWSGGNVWTPDNIVTTLQSAFLQLDDNISLTPARLIPTLANAAPTTDDVPTARQTLVALAKPAAAGAVAITALVDAENDDIYIASVGDCRAVAGWQSADGKWRCDTLSEDMSGDNPKEVERMRKEHPAAERDTVIKNGRVQGGLQPTRAFGDAVYKWTIAENDKIAEAFRAEGEKPRPQRPWNLTPPYVTAEPEVNYRKLQQANGEKLRFIILATDGLWDRITSEEATLLTASYLSHPTHNDIPKIALPNLYPLAPLSVDRPYPQQELPQPSNESWVYEGDENAATHLIRNSLAGADRKKRGELLSMHGEVTRWLRDDITVTVVFFDDK